MAELQHPLGPGFTPASTADEVLAGLDLTGTNVIVTGGHSRLGLATTRALTRAGASVTVAARTVDRAAALVAGIERVEISELDLLDPASIAAFAARWIATGRPLPILINSAALKAPAEVVRDARGYEGQFATGHLGHFQLTLALLPALRAAGAARVVTVSSGAHRLGEIRWDDVNFTSDYTPNAGYAQTKKANVLFAVDLDRRYRSDDIRGYAVHPGVVVAGDSAFSQEALRRMGLIDGSGQPIIDPAAGKKTPEQGAATIVFAATSPLLKDIGGVFLKDSDISVVDDEVRPLTADSIPSEAMSSSLDPTSAQRLWELSEDLLR